MINLTLDDITASWLGHGKQIPVGKMMQWLIWRVQDLEPRVAALTLELQQLKQFAETQKATDRKRIAELERQLKQKQPLRRLSMG
jgi:hypothetical protein